MQEEVQDAIDELRLMQDECLPQEVHSIDVVLAEIERLKQRLQEADAAMHYARQVLVHGKEAAEAQRKDEQKG